MNASERQARVREIRAGAELAAGAADADLLGASEEAHAVAEEKVILGHEGGPPPVW